MPDPAEMADEIHASEASSRQEGRPMKTEAQRAFGQEGHVRVSSEQTGDAFCVLRFFASPGNVTPPHVHHTTDETFLIESGEVEMNRGGELLRGRRGDVIYLPKGIPHALRVIGNEVGAAVVVCVPGGFDRFFAARSLYKTFRIWRSLCDSHWILREVCAWRLLRRRYSRAHFSSGNA
jgi:mannose-6-phosphate isomerase-like protein (cupin superfamily)